MSRFFPLVRAYGRLEFREREISALYVFFVLLLSVFFSLALSGAYLEAEIRRKIFPSLLWISAFVSGAVALGRSFEADLAHRALDALRLSRVPLGEVFLAKLFINWLEVAAGLVLSFISLVVLLDVTIPGGELKLLLTALLASISFSALATLLSAVSIFSRIRHILLPVILLPLVVPLLFAAVELTTQVVVDKNFDIDSPWVYLLLLLDVVYVSLGAWLFPHAIGE